MSDKPDWMNFGEEEDCTAAPTAFDDAFTTATAHHTPSTNTRERANDDVPLFLRDDAAALHASASGSASGTSSTPAFLSGMSAPEDYVGNPLRADGGASAGLPQAMQQHLTPEADATGAPSTAVMYADQPSAATVRFNGDSGHTWCLHRVRILGKGNYGCATLYSLDEEASTVAQPSPTRAVVVKDINVQTMLNPAEDMPAVQTELRVLRSAAGHPNLVQYVDALIDTRPASYPMCFIVMEFAAGGDLAALLERCSAPTVSSTTPTAALPAGAPAATLFSPGPDGGHVVAEDYVAAYLIQTAVALHSLHTEHGILHRDVKPHNIFLLEDGVTVRLGDFGISMQLGRVGEKAKEACGSPYFMAPEIFEETAYDSGADVWSLGVVFYQLMTHQLPFTASSVAGLGALVRRGQFARLSDATTSPSATASYTAKAAAYSKELRELVDSLLTVDAAARPTLRRVLRSRYVREHLHCVPVSVLQAKKPIAARPATASTSTVSPGERRQASTATAAVQFSEESLYASVFGAEAVAEAITRATSPGVTPIVNRIQHA